MKIIFKKVGIESMNKTTVETLYTVFIWHDKAFSQFKGYVYLSNPNTISLKITL